MTHETAAHGYEFGPFRLNPAEGLLLRAGRIVPLTPKAFDTLLLLVQNSGHVVSKERLFQILWPDSFVEENNLAVHIATLRKVLGENEDGSSYIENIPKRGYRFIAEVRETQADISDGGARVAGAATPVLACAQTLEPLGGALPLDSKFYIVRPADLEFYAATARQDSIVLVKGARQVGKTSLLARGLQQARADGAQVLLTDFQCLATDCLTSVEQFMRTLAELMAEQLSLAVEPGQRWTAHVSASVNFERFLRHEVLAQLTTPLVWGLDEVDRLFTCDFAGDVFSLFRSWHNRRALDPAGPWARLTLAITYATEAHLFITDLNQSPFNVGTQLRLEDFTRAEVAELNRRYDAPLRDAAEIARYFGLVAGQPYLVHCGLREMATHGWTLADLEAQVAHDQGPFKDHLRRLLVALTQNPALCAAVRSVLEGRPQLSAESFDRLHSAGVLAGASAAEAQLRCQLYATYLARHLP